MIAEILSGKLRVIVNIGYREFGIRKNLIILNFEDTELHRKKLAL